MNISNKDIDFLPLGGSGEIGMNCNLYHFSGSWIMIDLGVMFGNSNLSSNELIMPNLNYLKEKEIKLSGMILTHAHEDHIGAVPYLYDFLDKPPMYTTSFTASVLNRKFRSNGHKDINISLLDYNQRFKIGNFEIEILALTHSIPEPNAIVLRVNKTNIFHTGDWKIDPNPLIGQPIDEEKLSSLKNEGIDVMVCDSTNVFDENPSGSENEVRDSFRKLFSKKQKGKMIVTCFASNIARLETILKISSEFNKCCVFLGRSIHRIYESAIENNYLKDISNIVTEKESVSINEDELVIICTGSQGESKAALSRLANDQNNNISISEDDLIIFSSREIPGNERQISDLKNRLLKKGCQILDSSEFKVHVSGHPSKNELKKMYDWVSPNLLIPVHGEFRHLNEHASFAKKCGINEQILVENGDMVSLKKSKSKIIKKVFSGRCLLKGNQILQINDNYFNQLKTVGVEGECFVNLILDVHDNFLAEPVIFCPTVTDNIDLIDDLCSLIKSEVTSIMKEAINDEFLCSELKIQVRSFIKRNIGLKPLTYIEIVRI